MLRCMSPLLAQSGHTNTSALCPLLGVKRTWLRDGAASAYEQADMSGHVGS